MEKLTIPMQETVASFTRLNIPLASHRAIVDDSDFESLSSPEWVEVPYSGTSGVYSAVKPDADSVKIFGEICQRLGLEFFPDKTHCTLIYSKEAVLRDANSAIDLDPDAGFRALVTHVEHWSGHDEKTYIVAGLASDAIVMEHARLRRLGAEHSFTPFKAHVTLSSDATVDETMQKKIDWLNTQLAASPALVVFNNQVILDCKKD